jgi:hypothetical protein
MNSLPLQPSGNALIHASSANKVRRWNAALYVSYILLLIGVAMISWGYPSINEPNPEYVAKARLHDKLVLSGQAAPADLTYMRTDVFIYGILELIAAVVFHVVAAIVLGNALGYRFWIIKGSETPQAFLLMPPFSFPNCWKLHQMARGLHKV